ncbi:MAG TPA: hypothetical protein VIZ32_13215, partial [Vicinamibacterales bacterium]
IHAHLIPLTQRTIDGLLKLASRGLSSLSGAFEVPMALLELKVVLLQVLLDALDVLSLHVNHLLEGLASRERLVQGSTCDIELIADFAEYPFESCDFRRRASLQLFPLSRELLSISCELFTRSGKPLLRLRSHGRGCSLRRLDERAPMLVGNYTQNVRCRCAQVGFELTAEADADPVERRTDVVVERR